jgi:hypothetical protein
MAPDISPQEPPKGQSGPQQPPVAPNGPQSPTVAPNGPKRVSPRNTQYPFQLKVNMTPGMNASVRRVTQRLKVPEGTIGRWGMMLILAQHDPDYKGE